MAAAGALITAKYGPISPRGPAMPARFEFSSRLAYCRIQRFDWLLSLLGASMLNGVYRALAPILASKEGSV